MRRLQLRTVAGLALACAASACYTWEPLPAAPQVERALPAHIRVVEPSGNAVEVISVHVTQDSVVGVKAEGHSVTLPRDSVAFLEERHFSWARTLGLAAGVYFGTGIVVLLALGGV